MRRPPKPAPPAREALLGCGLITALNLLGLVVAMELGATWPETWFLFTFLPVVQLLWSIPLIVRARRTGRKVRASGMILASALVLLIWATCWTLFGLGTH